MVYLGSVDYSIYSVNKAWKNEVKKSKNLSEEQKKNLLKEAKKRVVVENIKEVSLAILKYVGSFWASMRF